MPLPLKNTNGVIKLNGKKIIIPLPAWLLFFALSLPLTRGTHTADSSSTFTPEARAAPPPPRAPYSPNDGGPSSSAEEGAARSARDSWHDGGMGVAGAWVRRRTRRARRLARRRPWEGRGAQGGPCDGGRARGNTGLRGGG